MPDMQDAKTQHQNHEKQESRRLKKSGFLRYVCWPVLRVTVFTAVIRMNMR